MTKYRIKFRFGLDSHEIEVREVIHYLEGFWVSEEFEKKTYDSPDAHFLILPHMITLIEKIDS